MNIVIPNAPTGLTEQVLFDTGIADGFVSTKSSVGDVYVAFNSHGVSAVAPMTDQFAFNFERRFHRQAFPVDSPPTKLASQIASSFASGKRGRLPIDWRGQSDFQRSVLEAAASIPVGQVRPYSWIASQIGRPSAVRAVGSALGQNPVPIVIACHRVVRADGTLGQYRFGPEMKSALLTHEGLDQNPPPAPLLGSATTGVVCYPSCSAARKIGAKNQRWFRTADSAKAQGFRPCQKCQPLI